MQRTDTDGRQEGRLVLLGGEEKDGEHQHDCEEHFDEKSLNDGSAGGKRRSDVQRACRREVESVLIECAQERGRTRKKSLNNRRANDSSKNLRDREERRTKGRKSTDEEHAERDGRVEKTW